MVCTGIWWQHAPVGDQREGNKQSQGINFPCSIAAGWLPPSLAVIVLLGGPPAESCLSPSSCGLCNSLRLYTRGAQFPAITNPWGFPAHHCTRRLLNSPQCVPSVFSWDPGSWSNRFHPEILRDHDIQSNAQAFIFCAEANWLQYR